METLGPMKVPSPMLIPPIDMAVKLWLMRTFGAMRMRRPKSICAGASSRMLGSGSPSSPSRSAHRPGRDGSDGGVWLMRNMTSRQRANSTRTISVYSS